MDVVSLWKKYVSTVDGEYAQCTVFRQSYLEWHEVGTFP